MNEKNSFESYSHPQNIRFYLYQKKQRITSLCRLSKIKQNNNQESIFITQYRRTSRQISRRKIIHQTESEKRI